MVDDRVRRPAPVQPLADRVRAWVDWFGVARIALSAVSMVVVCVGAFWLVRSPVPPAEAVLPRATGSAPPQVTLPPPTSVQIDQSNLGSDPTSQSAGGAQGSGEQSGAQGSGEQSGAQGSGEQNGGGAESDVIAVVVHVAGGVRRPGVYELPLTARVDDAVRLAGGPVDDADLDALNLAQTLADGSRVYVPLIGEEFSGELVSGQRAVTVSGSPSVGPASGPGSGPGGATSRVDVNRATADELDALPGVGPATAAAIVAERERNGPFLNAADLERVPGIGPAKIAGLLDLVTT